MTFAIDQQLDPEKLSETSRKMYSIRDVVIREWETRVRSVIKEARELREPVIVDTLPSFYDNIVQAVSPSYPRANATEGSALAMAHGSERARLTDYDPNALIHEFQVFRMTIFDVFEEHELSLNTQEFNAINSSIDQAIRESVSAFSSTVSGMREQFIAALTHDLRTPLQAASMAAELITHISDPVRTGELARRIITHLDRMDTMLQGMLDTMAFQTGEKLRLDLSRLDMFEVAKEVCQNTADSATSRCQVVGISVYGWWDREAMKRVLENLLGNALKYGDPQAPICIKVDEQHKNLVLSVHNEGLPIPMEEQQIIFAPFRRASNVEAGKKPGWGVGLSYVRAVAESHGGSIVLDSARDRGTTFTITVPVDSRPFQRRPLST